MMLALLMSFTSCMNADLPDLPTYTNADITQFSFEYRFQVPVGNAGPKLQVKTLDTDVTIDGEGSTVYCSITVPDAAGTFTAEERAKVTLSNIVGIANISSGATIKPIGDSPKLGKRSDFSKKEFQYQVVGANGLTKDWKLVIRDFKK